MANPPTSQMENLLTVVIQTSPLPSHPSTSLMEALLCSFDRVDGLKDSNIILLCDGCDQDRSNAIYLGSDKQPSEKRNNYKHGSTLPSQTIENYLMYLKQLRDKIRNRTPPYCPTHHGSIRLLELPKRYGSANALEAVFDIISNPETEHGYICTESSDDLPQLQPTPFVMIGQHDNFFVKDVHYLPEMLEYMQQKDTTSWLQCLHFPSTATLNYVEKIEKRYQLDLQPFCYEYTSELRRGTFVPLVFWYGRTHIARWKYYTNKILTDYLLKSGDHLEEVWGNRQLKDLMELNKKDNDQEFDSSFRCVHRAYGNYVFFELSEDDGVNNQQEVLYHLSGRKARAATSSGADSIGLVSTTTGTTLRRHTAFNPHENSFTTARSAAAIVPGLELALPNVKKQTPKGKFKQRCFHCGEKGHSKNYCPRMATDENLSTAETEVLNLT